MLVFGDWSRAYIIDGGRPVMPVGQEMQDEFEDDNLLAAGPRDCILDEENI